MLAVGLATTVCRAEPAPALPEIAAGRPADLRNSVGMDLMLIPAGTVSIGSADGLDNERPVHDVRITKPFYLGAHEVTNAQWKAVIGEVPSKWQEADRPVEKVSWDDAVDFCRKLSAMPEEREAGRVYRLPTEAEWEYACRAGTTTRYSFGDDDDEVALEEYGWFSRNSGGEPNPVGRKKPNPWGLHDMHGNVWEWCSDWYGNYAREAATDPSGPAGGSFRVCRGGGWGDRPGTCRSAFRSLSLPDSRGVNLGFRVALSAPGTEPSEQEP